jgi:hypothetical protein
MASRRLENPPHTPGASRWWSAPARVATAPLALLRKAVQHTYTASPTWLLRLPGDQNSSDVDDAAERTSLR